MGAGDSAAGAGGRGGRSMPDHAQVTDQDRQVGFTVNARGRHWKGLSRGRVMFPQDKAL